MTTASTLVPVEQVSPVGVRIRGLRMSYGETEILKGIDLDIPAGKVTCILGPSGSGKSTLLRCINGLASYNGGVIDVGGDLIGRRISGGRLRYVSERELNKQRTHIGMVFQNFNLFPHMTIIQNLVEAPIHVHGVKRKPAEERARQLIAQVGLAGREADYPRQLSGGQQQRVAIARALAIEPRVVLFDEPTSALDPLLVGEVLEVMGQLAQSGITMVVVTHELRFTRNVADNVVLMDGGLVVEDGPPQQLFTQPRDPRTEAFLDKVAE